MELEFGLVISQILAFLAMLWIMKRFAWKPFLSILEARRKKIEDEFASLEEQKNQVQTLSEKYNEQLAKADHMMREKMQEATEQARQIAQKIHEDAKEEAREVVNKARADISQEVLKAKKHLKEDLVNLVVGATEKLIHEKVDAEKDREMVRQFVEEMK